MKLGQVSRPERPDFNRKVEAVLGLPLDVLSEEEVEAALRASINDRKRLFLSTPNLNFAIAGLRDVEFRQTVLDSDLNIPDGWPLVLISRILGGSLRSRVSGSDLFERICSSSKRPPVKVYFFGGPSGVAPLALEKLNSRNAGATCVGVYEPGFGDVESMSGSGQIERINSSKPDFLVVSLGAQKGQRWIQKNLQYLDVPVVSHLGAVINFVAGSIARAPGWIKKIHLEWLWRIFQEPKLFSRYRDDSLVFLRVLWLSIFSSIRSRWAVPSPSKTKPEIKIFCEKGMTRVSLRGNWVGFRLDDFRQVLREATLESFPATIDLSCAEDVGADAVGLIMLLHGWNIKMHGNMATVQSTNALTYRRLSSLQALYLLEPNKIGS